MTQIMERPARRDALPEETKFADTGCDLHPRCLTCPFVRCRYDDAGGVPAQLRPGRDEWIRQLAAEGVQVDEIGRRFGLSRRTVFRVVAAGRGQS